MSSELELIVKENKYLKRLLEENDIHYVEIREVENIEYTKDEKIRIYTSYFKGRNDIFAERYFRKSDNQKGYSPVCRNKYGVNCDLKKYVSCKGCPYKEYYGMGTGDLLNHFRSEKLINLSMHIYMYAYLLYPHVVNNVVRRHIQITVYSQSQETVFFDEWNSGCGCGR